MKESLIDPAAPLGDPGPEPVDQNPFMEIFPWTHGENMPEAGCRPVAYGKDQHPAQKPPQVLDHSSRLLIEAYAYQHASDRLMVQSPGISRYAGRNTDYAKSDQAYRLKGIGKNFFVSGLQYFYERKEKRSSTYKSHKCHKKHHQVSPCAITATGV